MYIFLFRFVGDYSVLWGNRMENIAPIFSGGIHECYVPPIANKLSDSSFEIGEGDYIAKDRWTIYTTHNLFWCKPNLDELYTIIETALEQNNTVSCDPVDDIVFKKYVLQTIHSYAVTEVLVSQGTRFVRVHNPHNTEPYDLFW